MADGLTLDEIGKRYSVTYEAIRLRLQKTGLEKRRKQYKALRKLEKEIAIMETRELRQKIVGALYSTMLAKAEGDWPMLKAIEYCFTRRRSQDQIDFSTLERFCRRYYNAKDKGEKLRLKELIMGLEMGKTTASVVLKYIGEKPLFGTSKRNKITRTKEEQMGRALRTNTRLSYEDMAAIIGVSKRSMANRVRNSGLSKKQYVLSYAGSRGATGPNTKPECITYAKGFNFLEAMIAGFSRSEAMEYAGLRLAESAEYVLENRREIMVDVNRFRKAVGMRL